MAASKRRRFADAENDSSENSDNEENSDEETSEQNIEVDFEAYPPTDADYDGIKRLIRQLFLNTHLNVSQLTDLLIEQSGITSVVKQALDDEQMDMDDVEDCCFGVFSMINMTQKKDLECVKQLQSFLVDQCSKSCTEKQAETFRSYFGDDEKHLGWIISERFVNTPHELSVLLYDTLRGDMDEANKAKLSFNFGSIMIIAKILTPKDKPVTEESLLYDNAEEELFKEIADFQFDFVPSTKIDPALDGEWDSDDKEWDRMRRVMVFSGDKWPSMVESLKNQIPLPK